MSQTSTAQLGLHPDLKARILKDVSWLGGGHFLALGLVMAQGLISARWLGPQLFGAWSLCQLLLYYSMYLHMGTGHAMVRELPSLGDDDAEVRGRRIVAASFTVTTLMLLMSAAIVLLMHNRSGYAVPGMDKALSITGLTLVLQGLFQFAIFYFRGRSRFATIAISTLVMNTVAFLLLVALIPRWGLIGAALSWAFTYVIMFLFLWKRAHSSFRFSLDLAQWKRVIRIGAPVFATDVIFALVWTVDRLAIATLRAPEDLGYYSAAAVCLRLLMLVPDLLQQALYPHWARQGVAVEPETADSMPQLLKVPLRVLCWLLAALQGSAFVVLPLLFEVFLPTFRPAIRIAQVLVLGIGFLAIGQFLGFFLTTAQAARTATRIQVQIVILHSTLAFGSLYLGFSLMTLAFLSLVCNLIYVLAMSAAVRAARPTAALGARDILLPWLVVGSAAVAIDEVRMHLTGILGFRDSTLITLLALAVPLLLAGFYVARRQGPLKDLWPA